MSDRPTDRDIWCRLDDGLSVDDIALILRCSPEAVQRAADRRPDVAPPERKVLRARQGRCRDGCEGTSVFAKRCVYHIHGDPGDRRDFRLLCEQCIDRLIPGGNFTLLQPAWMAGPASDKQTAYLVALLYRVDPTAVSAADRAYCTALIDAVIDGSLTKGEASLAIDGLQQVPRAPTHLTGHHFPRVTRLLVASGDAPDGPDSPEVRRLRAAVHELESAILMVTDPDHPYDPPDPFADREPSVIVHSKEPLRA